MRAALDEVDIVRVAKKACTSKGIQWCEPYRVKKGWRYWRALTPSNNRGAMPRS